MAGSKTKSDDTVVIAPNCGNPKNLFCCSQSKERKTENQRRKMWSPDRIEDRLLHGDCLVMVKHRLEKGRSHVAIEAGAVP